MASVSTEITLATWRSGTTQAERLAAALLRIEGFLNVEPQAPLGGPDGRADVLCDRGGYRYVAAAYFPTTPQDYKDVANKFRHDIEGVLRHSRNAFAFFTNQRLTRENRDVLKAMALERNIECEVYDVERIRGMLDEPAGYGIRAEFLGISMNHEEQIAYFTRRENLLDLAINRNTGELRRLAEMVARIDGQSRVVAQTITAMALAASGGEFPLSPRSVDPLSLGELTAEQGMGRITWSLSPDLLFMTHRMVCFQLPSRIIGRFRTQEVSVVLPGEAPRQLTPFAEIAARLSMLCDNWNVSVMAASSESEHLNAIATFHHRFLSIHPFFDGNGRTARALLLQQCLDSFGRADISRLDRGVAYQQALVLADGGDRNVLVDLIRAIVK